MNNTKVFTLALSIITILIIVLIWTVLPRIERNRAKEELCYIYIKHGYPIKIEMNGTTYNPMNSGEAQEILGSNISEHQKQLSLMQICINNQ